MLKRMIPVAFMFMLLVACGKNKKNNGENSIQYDHTLIQRIRTAATSIPGALPDDISYVKYASSPRKWNTLVDSADEHTAVMARTAFQIHYADGWIMVDAGMDSAVHHFFEKDGPQPFNAEKADSVRMAVDSAKLILITHEHGDHAAGAVRGGAHIPPKTILTREQLDVLMHNPQMPEITITEEKSKQYKTVDLKDILAVAPGIVLVKAPGHTKGEIIIYTRLASGREYMFTGDVSWTYKGIAEQKQKPASERKRVGEDDEMVGRQLAWLNSLMKHENIIMLVSHDDVMLPQYVADDLLKMGMRTRRK